MTLTPEQFNKLTTKQDLEDLANDLREEMVTKKEHNEVMNTLDAVMVKLDNIEHAFVSNLAAHDRFEERISRLENYVGINQPKVGVINKS